MNKWEVLSGEDPVNGIYHRIIYVCSYCAPELAIPPDLILQILQSGGKVEDMDFNQAIQHLVDLDFLHWSEGNIIIEKEITIYGRDQDSGSGQSVLPSLAGKMTDLSYQKLVNGSKQDRQILRPHLHSIAMASQIIHPQKASGLWNNLSMFHRLEGEYTEARHYSEQALACEEKAFGPDHPNVANRYNSLGNGLQVEGDLAGARLCFEKALDIDERAFGKEHPKLAVRLNRLGSLLQSQGERGEAIGYCERALAIDVKALGESHPDVGIDLNDLGLLLMETGELSRARNCLEQALGIFEKYYPGNHRYIQVVRGSLSKLDNTTKTGSEEREVP